MTIPDSSPIGYEADYCCFPLITEPLCMSQTNSSSVRGLQFIRKEDEHEAATDDDGDSIPQCV